MSVAHKASRLILKNVPVPVDNNTYALWNFNRNLVSTINHIYPEGLTRTMAEEEIHVNYIEDIVAKGKFGLGITIDEYTENAFIYPMTQEYYSGALRTADSYYKTDGYRIIAINQPLNGPLPGCRLDIASGKFTVSGKTDRTDYITIYWKGFDSLDNVVINQTSINATVVNGKFEKTIDLGTVPDLSYIHIGVGRINEQNYWVENIQVEAKPYATRFVDGTRVPTYIKYQMPSNIKTISFWFKSNSNKEVVFSNTSRVLLSQTIDGTTDSDYWVCYIGRDGEPYITKNKVSLEVHSGSTAYKCCIDEVNPLDGNWHHVTIELNTTSIMGLANTVARLWVDEYYTETRNGTLDEGYPSPITFNGYLRVGHIDETESTALSNCTYDELCIRTAHYDPDEILSWYISNREFYNPYDYSISAL